jgi:hypothetical protein
MRWARRGPQPGSNGGRVGRASVLASRHVRVFQQTPALEGLSLPRSSCNPATGPEGLLRRVERGVECGVFSAALACTEPTPRPSAAASVAAVELARQENATAINPPPMGPGFAEDSLTPPGRGSRLDRQATPKGRQSGAEDTALETGPALRAGSPPRAWTFLRSKMWLTTGPTGVAEHRRPSTREEPGGRRERRMVELTLSAEVSYFPPSGP